MQLSVWFLFSLYSLVPEKSSCQKSATMCGVRCDTKFGAECPSSSEQLSIFNTYWRAVICLWLDSASSDTLQSLYMFSFVACIVLLFPSMTSGWLQRKYLPKQDMTLLILGSTVTLIHQKMQTLLRVPLTLTVTRWHCCHDTRRTDNRHSATCTCSPQVFKSFMKAWQHWSMSSAVSVVYDFFWA